MRQKEICLFSKYFLSTYYMLGTVLRASNSRDLHAMIGTQTTNMQFQAEEDLSRVKY